MKILLGDFNAEVGRENICKILLGDFNAEVGRENICKPTIGNESLHQAKMLHGH
jgi:endonuclease/exonuclease/phosphatase family metal-dependent hydrolase